MTYSAQLNEKWIKASILGTIWASSEIVLGSFLHNLRIPFSGNILTAIALVILISASYMWRDKGLFWRAGIICALLKTMSPSAVIFGPMIAIISESILLEIAVRIFGHSIPGFLIGSVLAMSWNLFQKVFNFIIFYGFNIVQVYTNLMEYAQRQLSLEFDAVWAPLILLLFLFALFGAVSALVGIRTGRELISNPREYERQIFATANNNKKGKQGKDFNYSIFWLVLNVLLIAGTLISIGRINFGIWVLLVVSIATAWAFRYQRALRQLVRPRLWVFFVLITMLSAFAFTKLQSNSTTWIDGIKIGLEMNFRAVILIMGFSVLGTELYHPKIRKYFSKGYFKQLPVALELSLESLPAMIANTPDVKTLLTKPGKVVNQMMLYADFRLKEIRNTNSIDQPKHLILTGAIGAGKTTLIKKLIDRLSADNSSVAGIYTLRQMENSETTGYDVVNISTGKSERFLRTEGTSSQERIGKFFLYREGLEAGNEALLNVKQTNLIIVDEIGKLELAGKGWSTSVKHLLKAQNSFFLLSVREIVVDEIIQKFGISPQSIFRVSGNNTDEIISEILEEISTQ